MTAEFDVIEKYFHRQKSKRSDVLIGIGDDAALVQVPTQQNLTLCIDTLVAGVHFPLNTDPFDIAYKAVAVNLSDLAAMGSEPAWLTLALTMPIVDHAWLERFCAGFFSIADQFNVQLIGGDLTKGPLTISVQAHGFVPHEKAIKRSGAKPGDYIYITGTLGDAGLALQLLKNNKAVPEELLQKLNRPIPRVTEGIALRGLANSAIDISDGLIADLNHILKASKVGATICVDQIPLSLSLKELTESKNALELALTAGDDYELCFTIPAELEGKLKLNNVTRIGTIDASSNLKLQHANGQPYHTQKTGYQHF